VRGVTFGLTSPPGTIASIVALTAHSGFGELLLPYDDTATMRRKLAGLRFRLDQRTGAIVAEEANEGEYVRMGPDDTKMSLLGNRQQQPPSYSYPEWEYYKTPYDH
jgi:hypothetical protein